MKWAMARQAEAEREKRAKIIAAQGEALAVDQLGGDENTTAVGSSGTAHR